MIPQQIVIEPVSASTLSSFHHEDENYLTKVTTASSRLLCCDSEGWGPLNPGRNGLTPCFLSSLILFVSAFGIVGGVPTLWWLSRSKNEEAIQTNWRFWAKLVSNGLLSLA